ncbi:preprotein translocase subunit SecG [Tardibacter chloracetimidivorans]|uniref:Protein-export membrane protein SecG n=1 Tax=Tardibacter chloracetimidivorans TaxID=1921510 RepID=A0A1L3ZRA3_9SPHN|nr:preprotein translocase subunit SecG [Tardibacter chloracetimidivorans]API58156.1 preprotein translocase subunit SecG [Tardibacter chloracetimidivorans]
MFHTLLLVIQILIAAALVGVILMQRSEGGGLSGGGSASGLMSARGAGDFLTRTTAVLGALFVLNSIGLAVLASVDRNPRQIDTSLTAPAAPVPSQLPPVPVTDGGDTSVTSPATADEAAPAPQDSPVPLAE